MESTCDDSKKIDIFTLTREELLKFPVNLIPLEIYEGVPPESKAQQIPKPWEIDNKFLNKN